MNGLDVSEPSLITPEWVIARRAEGYKLLIVDAWTGNHSPAGVRDALYKWAAWTDLKGAAYFVIHNGRPVAEHFAKCQEAVGDMWSELAFVAIDCEVNITTAEMALEAVDLVVAAGKRPIIYTRKSFWVEDMGNPGTLSHIPLWDARYTPTPSLEAPGYGAWSARTGHQYQDTTNIDGVPCDLNLFDDVWVAGVDEKTQALNTIWGWAQQMRQAADELEASVRILKGE